MSRKDFEPCKGCTKRFPACQDVCPEKAKADRLRAAATEKERANSQWLGHVKDVCYKIKADKFRRRHG